MVTSTRRRKPAPADAAVPDILDTLVEAATLPDSVDAPPSGAEAAPDAPAPAKRPRAPRKAAATPRKRVAAAAKVPAAEAAGDAPASEPAQPELAITEPAVIETAVTELAAIELPVIEPAAVADAPPAPPAPKPRRRGRGAATSDRAATPEAPPVHDTAAEPPQAATAPIATAPVADAPVATTPVADAPAAGAAEAFDEVEPAEATALAASAAPAEPAESTEAAEPVPPLPESSRLTLDDGLQRRLRWQAGSRCPGTLAQAAQRWQPDRGAPWLALTHLDELTELLAIAARTGHEVEVDEAVWAHLARLGDLQARIAHLESRHPQGLDPAAQPEASLLAGWRACQLEAAFFAACVGRCVLADEPALKPEDELLLAARLVMQHFGASAPLVLAPAEAHGAWQAAWERVWPVDAPAERPALALLAPDQPVPLGTELLLLDQRGGLQPAQAESPAAQAAGWLWVLAPHDLLERPEALALLAAVDQLRQGGLAAWQDGGDAAALAPVLLARRFAEVASQWPAWAPAVRATPAAADEVAWREQLAQRLARWQRSGFLADSDQLALRRALQSLWAAARAANSAALPALLTEALAQGAGRIVVFSEDAAALPALADALRASGLPAGALPPAGSPRLADQSLRAFREAAEPRILLVADGPAALDGAEPRIGVQLAEPLVIHLDTPWPADALARRLLRVRPGPAQREVPVWQLLPEGSLMARRAQAQPAEPAAAPRLTGALLRGPALAAWLQELAALP